MKKYSISTPQGILRLLCILGLSALASCSVNSVNLTPEVLQQRGLKPGEGLIVGSYQSRDYTFKGEEARSMVTSSMVRAHPRGSRTRVIINNNKASGVGKFLFPGLGQGGDGCFAIPLPAGSYEIDGWNISANVGTGTLMVMNKLPLKIPFNVQAGQATYLGQVNVLSLYGKSLLGINTFSRGVIIITDSYEKDAKEITRTYPSIKPSQIKRSDVPSLYAKEMKRVADTPVSLWKSIIGGNW